MILNPAVAESLSARSGIVIQVSDVDSNAYASSYGFRPFRESTP